MKKSFHILRLALLIDGNCDSEISVKGVDDAYLVEGWTK